MTRWLWILGLCLALVFYSGWVVLILIAGFRLHHLNGKGIFLLTMAGYITWFTFQYLLVKIRNQPYVEPPEEEPIELPRLL